MAYWTRDYSNGSYYANWNCRLQYVLDSQGANSSHISLYLVTYSDSSAYSQWGLWDGRIYVNGGQVARATPTQTISNGAVQLTSWGGDISHDVNGNAYITIGDYINAPANECTHSDIGWDLPRIALAPTISSTTSSDLTTNSATIASAVSSHGHGTSSTIRYYLRVSGVGSYVDKGTGSSKALTGLSPNTTYQWYITATNNNGDVQTSGVQTFTTKSGVKVITTDGVEDRVVKQILPSGDVLERVVTKIV